MWRENKKQGKLLLTKLEELKLKAQENTITENELRILLAIIIWLFNHNPLGVVSSKEKGCEVIDYLWGDTIQSFFEEHVEGFSELELDGENDELENY